MKSRFEYRVSVLKSILPYAKKTSVYIGISLLLGIIIFATGVITPLLYRSFIDSVVLGGNFSVFTHIAIGYVVLYSITSSAKYINSLVNINFGNSMILNLKRRMLEYYFSLSHEDYSLLSTGDVKIRIDNDVNQLRSYIDSQCVGLTISYIAAFASLSILFLLDWRLACYSACVIPTTILIDNCLSKQEQALNEKRRIIDQDLSSWLQETTKGWREIRAFHLEKRQERKYNNYLAQQAVYYGVWINYWTTRVLVLPQIRNTILSKFGLYFLGGLLILRGRFNIGGLLIFALYFDQLSAAIQKISEYNSDLISNAPHLDRIIAVLDQPSPPRMAMMTRFNAITINDVSYRYPSAEEPILNNINLKIEQGEWIAIVGKSGTGKSTLIKLIGGLLFPTSGNITFDQFNSNEIDVDSLHEHIGIIMQENVLYNGTIRENLKYGRMAASDSEMTEACKSAGIFDFINHLPEGLDTQIGEKGIKLSAGQRQRIALARLFLKSPQVYIFDEATSNLDSNNEIFIHDALKNIDANTTVIIVTHRKSTLKLCDKVFSVEENRFIS